ncbi:hypothetical protein AB0L57_31570 [Nocardia sp. NPDC052254]
MSDNGAAAQGAHRAQPGVPRDAQGAVLGHRTGVRGNDRMRVSRKTQGGR